MADAVAYAPLDPAVLSGTQVYDLMVGAIQPRPIAFVSTVSVQGVPNLAPFSFFMPGGSNPPSLALSITLGVEGRRKDTLRNIEEQGEFVANVVTRSMAEGMSQTSASFPPETSEWDPSGFLGLPSVRVQPSRVAGSPVQFECRLVQIVSHGADLGAAVYVVGEVVMFHVRSDCWNGGQVTNIAPIARLGGSEYLDLDELARFTMSRPNG